MCGTCGETKHTEQVNCRRQDCPCPEQNSVSADSPSARLARLSETLEQVEKDFEDAKQVIAHLKEKRLHEGRIFSETLTKLQEAEKDIERANEAHDRHITVRNERDQLRIEVQLKDQEIVRLRDAVAGTTRELSQMKTEIIKTRGSITLGHNPITECEFTRMCDRVKQILSCKLEAAQFLPNPSDTKIHANALLSYEVYYALTMWLADLEKMKR